MNTHMKTFNSNICRILFAACLSALCLVALSAQAATITVTNTNDSGAGSLRQAMADAVNGDTIDFGVTGTITLTTGELVVDKSVTINGPGATNLAVNGNHASRVFHVSSGTTVTITGLAITNGSPRGSWPDNTGGGIYNDHATLTLSHCMVSANSASFGGGLFNDGSSTSATLTVSNCTFSGNSAGGGGGIYNDSFAGSATLTLNNSTFSSNSASSNAGGGIVNSGDYGSATLTVNGSTFSSNSAPYFGGGICNSAQYGSATLAVNNCTFSGNSTDLAGGGIYCSGVYGSATLTLNSSTFSSNSATSYGGGIFNANATLTLSNSTVSGNSAAYWGGGIYNAGHSASATLTLNNSTFSGNSAGVAGGNIDNDGSFGGVTTLDLTDTILNAGASGENIYNYDGTVTSHGYNLSSDNGGGFLTATGDQINTTPMLGPLQDNGGPTFTHAPLQGSPAIDAGDPNFDPNAFNPPMLYDQRGPGYNRVAHGRVDIGALEVQTVTPAYAGHVQPPINADGSSTFNVRRGVVPVRFNLTLAGVATCDLPPATIAVTRTAGGVIGQVNESDYSGNADTGSNFRISSCQYVYNLNARALGVGTYRVDILIDGQVVGNAVFALQ
jgi:Chlamydia polymorphic membrane protein (Chlamydia_PMP) repeat